MPVISELKRWRQREPVLEANLAYTESSSQPELHSEDRGQKPNKDRQKHQSSQFEGIIAYGKWHDQDR